jgi:Protein of unknown function (DUF1441)
MNASAQRVSRAEFARMQGWSKSYVTKLGDQGRLVEADRLIDVQATLEKIRGTTTAPSRAAPQVSGIGFVDAAERDKFYSAELRRLEFEKHVGQLLQAEVRRVVADAVATLGRALDGLPDILAPQLAMTDEANCRAVLRDALHAARHELARKFQPVQG